MQDRFKFRIWDKKQKKLAYPNDNPYHNMEMVNYLLFVNNSNLKWDINNYELMQCTGLKDKNGLTLLYECDIINNEGIKIGNCYENQDLLKNTTNFIIKGMGTKEWRSSEQEAIKRGCYYAE